MRGLLRDRQKSRSRLPSNVRHRKGGIFLMTRQKSIPTKCQASTCLSEVFPASRLVLRGSGVDSKIREELCSIILPELSKPKGLQLFSLKTYPVYYRTVRGKLTKQFLKRFQSWGIVWNGVCITAQISASRSSGGECSLSDILISDAPEKYFLSQAAEERILRNLSMERKDKEFTPLTGQP